MVFLLLLAKCNYDVVRNFFQETEKTADYPYKKERLNKNSFITLSETNTYTVQTYKYECWENLTKNSQQEMQFLNIPHGKPNYGPLQQLKPKEKDGERESSETTPVQET